MLGMWPSSHWRCGYWWHWSRFVNLRLWSWWISRQSTSQFTCNSIFDERWRRLDEKARTSVSKNQRSLQPVQEPGWRLAFFSSFLHILFRKTHIEHTHSLAHTTSLHPHIPPSSSLHPCISTWTNRCTRTKWHTWESKWVRCIIKRHCILF